jgi:hypothetical protein
MSEVPFLLFTYLVFLLVARAHDETRSPGVRRWAALGAGAALYLACGTRSIGIVLVPCVLTEGWLRRHRPGRVTPLVLAAFTVGVAAQRLLLPFDGSYLDQLVLDPRMFGRNLLWMLRAVGLYADNGGSVAGVVLSVSAVGGLGLLGCLDRARRGITSREGFLVLYPAVLLVWPSAESTQRFLLPLAPLVLVYACQALRRLGAWCGPAWEHAPAGILACSLLVVYAFGYSRADFGSLREGIGKAESVELLDYVRRRTPPEAVVLFQKPRALALLTGRRSSALHVPRDDDDLWRYLRAIRATYAVADRDMFALTPNPLRAFARRHPDRLREVFRNGDFTVYALVEETPALRAAR